MAEVVDSIIAQLEVRGLQQYEQNWSRATKANDDHVASLKRLAAAAKLADDMMASRAARGTPGSPEAKEANAAVAAVRRAAKEKADAEKAAAREAADAVKAAEREKAAAAKASAREAAAAAREAAPDRRLVVALVDVEQPIRLSRRPGGTRPSAQSFADSA